MRTRSLTRTVGWALAAVAVAAAAHPGWAQALNRCATAPLPGPVVLPDGSRHDASAITLCLRHTSPVSGIHELRVDGMPVGMVRSWIDDSEGLASVSPVVVFERAALAEVRLLGYAWPAGDHMQVFVLRSSDGPDPVARADAGRLLEARADRYFVAANLRSR